MNKYNTKPGQLLSFVERPRFEKATDDTEADKYSTGFLERQQFVIMVYARLANQNGLRNLAHSLYSSSSLYHPGIHKDVKRSTIF